MRLIDADALIGRFESLSNDDWNKETGTTWARAFEESANMVDDAPTIDAVPVVRCRNCKHRDPEDRKCDCGHGILWQLQRDYDWFCADGERREDGKH